jgi:hypothetical protein
VRTEIVGPLIAAITDGTAVVTAQSRVWGASRTQSAAQGLRKRPAARVLNAASDEREAVETATRQRWGSVPATAAGVEAWAETVTAREAGSHPRVVEQRERMEEAKEGQRELAARHAQERRVLVRKMFGDRTPSSPREQAAQWQEQAETARRDLTAIEALPPTEAAQIIRDRAAQEQARRQALEPAVAERKARAAKLHDFAQRPTPQEPTPPSRGLGL